MFELTYRFWLLAHTVQNLSLNLSSATMLLSACASLAPSMPMGFGSAGGGGGGGGTGAAAACCCRALNRGSVDMVKTVINGCKAGAISYYASISVLQILHYSQQMLARELLQRQ
jgi:hypothetical protein